jgi:hypothetical protein
MCRTPEELAAPVDEAEALSFLVPLGRGGTELGGIGTATGSKVGKLGKLGKLGKGAKVGKGGKLGLPRPANLGPGKAVSRRATTKAAAKSMP